MTNEELNLFHEFNDIHQELCRKYEDKIYFWSNGIEIHKPGIPFDKKRLDEIYSKFDDKKRTPLLAIALNNARCFGLEKLEDYLMERLMPIIQNLSQTEYDELYDICRELDKENIKYELH